MSTSASQDHRVQYVVHPSFPPLPDEVTGDFITGELGLFGQQFVARQKLMPAAPPDDDAAVQSACAEAAARESAYRDDERAIASVYRPGERQTLATAMSTAAGECDIICDDHARLFDCDIPDGYRDALLKVITARRKSRLLPVKTTLGAQRVLDKFLNQRRAAVKRVGGDMKAAAFNARVLRKYCIYTATAVCGGRRPVISADMVRYWVTLFKTKHVRSENDARALEIRFTAESATVAMVALNSGLGDSL